MSDTVSYAPAPTAPPGTPEYAKQYAAYLKYESAKEADGAAPDSPDRVTPASEQNEGYTYTAKVSRRGHKRPVTVTVKGVDAATRAGALAEGRKRLEQEGGQTRSGKQVPGDQIRQVYEERAARPRGATKPRGGAGGGDDPAGSGDVSNDAAGTGEPTASAPNAAPADGAGADGDGGENPGNGDATAAQQQMLAQAQQGCESCDRINMPQDLVLLRKHAAPLECDAALSQLVDISARVTMAALETLPESVQRMVAAAVGQAQLSAQTQMDDGSTLQQTVERIVQEREPAVPPARDVVITMGDATDDGAVASSTVVQNAHEKLPEVLELLDAGEIVCMIGPTGCGKTHLWYQAAESMGWAVGSISFTAGVQEWHLTGKREPTGNGGMRYVPSTFVRAYESDEPYAFLFDEADSADPGVFLIVNQALANDRLPLPNRPEKDAVRGKGAMFGVSMNTYGRGADRLYSGRTQLDAATRDRVLGVSVVEMEYDRSLERALVTGEGSQEYLTAMWDLRDLVEQHGLETFVSTRQIVRGWRMVRRFPSWDIDRVRQKLTADWTATMKRKAGLTT